MHIQIDGQISVKSQLMRNSCGLAGGEILQFSLCESLQHPGYW